jgi:hypothetical protein
VLRLCGVTAGRGRGGRGEFARERGDSPRWSRWLCICHLPAIHEPLAALLLLKQQLGSCSAAWPCACNDFPLLPPLLQKDKQCSVKIGKGLAPQGNFTYAPGENTAPATYLIQV